MWRDGRGRRELEVVVERRMTKIFSAVPRNPTRVSNLHHLTFTSLRICDYSFGSHCVHDAGTDRHRSRFFFLLSATEINQLLTALTPAGFMHERVDRSCS